MYDVFELVEGENHDADCQRRRSRDGWRLICSCGMTDEQIAKTDEKVQRKADIFGRRHD